MSTSTPHTGEAPIIEDLNTGDVMLFNRKCSAMGDPIGIFLCGCAKLTSKWDHTGLVYNANHIDFEKAKELPKDHPQTKIVHEITRNGRKPSPSGLYVVESNVGGVTVRPIEDRIRRSRSHEIAIRHLEVPPTAHELLEDGGNCRRRSATDESKLNPHLRSNEFRKNFDHFIADHIGVDYKTFIFDFVASIAYPPDKQERIVAARRAGSLLSMHRAVDAFNKELTIVENDVNQFEKNNKDADANIRKINVARGLLSLADKRIDEQLERIKSSHFPATTPVDESIGSTTSEKVLSMLRPQYWLDGTNEAGVEGKGMFCSELCATGLQRVGVLLPYPPASNYSPYDYSDQRSEDVFALQHHSKFSSHIYVRPGRKAECIPAKMEESALVGSFDPTAPSSISAELDETVEAVLELLLSSSTDALVEGGVEQTHSSKHHDDHHAELVRRLVMDRLGAQTITNKQHHTVEKTIEDVNDLLRSRDEASTKERQAAKLSAERVSIAMATEVPRHLLLVGSGAAFATWLMFPLQMAEMKRNWVAMAEAAAPGQTNIKDAIQKSKLTRGLAGMLCARTIVGISMHAGLIFAVSQLAKKDAFAKNRDDHSAITNNPLRRFINFFLDTSHPYTALVFCAGTMGIVASCVTYPAEVLFALHCAKRLHPEAPSLGKLCSAYTTRFGLRGWWSGCKRHFLLLVPYVGAGHWVMYSEAVAPLMLPAKEVPSMLRPKKHAKNDESVENGMLWLRLASITAAACCAHSVVVYASESCRRYDLMVRASSIAAEKKGAQTFPARPRFRLGASFRGVGLHLLRIPFSGMASLGVVFTATIAAKQWQ